MFEPPFFDISCALGLDAKSELWMTSGKIGLLGLVFCGPFGIWVRVEFACLKGLPKSSRLERNVFVDLGSNSELFSIRLINCYF